MPSLRVLTWNSNGGAAPRGAELVAAANALNAFYPAHPLQLCVCQEAGVAPDSIHLAFTGSAPFSVVFSQPPSERREHLPPPAQPFRIAPSRNYRMTYRIGGPAALNLAAVGGFQLVNLSHLVDLGVNAWINAQGLAPVPLQNVRQCAGNMRWPVYQQFGYAGGTVHFFTWHAPLLANWLGANFSGHILPGGGLWEAFQFFQHSNFYNGILAGLGAADAIIIAGDLNTIAGGLGFPNMFPNYQGYSFNLSHILVHSPGMALGVAEGHNSVSPNSPHELISARVIW